MLKGMGQWKRPPQPTGQGAGRQLSPIAVQYNLVFDFQSSPTCTMLRRH
ncbi:MAG: hypothetical protein J0L94_16345 [Rhodothermia bacterium]|nr:hypothetical protein [Rhodothermia bacterium]